MNSNIEQFLAKIQFKYCYLSIYTCPVSYFIFGESQLCSRYIAFDLICVFFCTCSHPFMLLIFKLCSRLRGMTACISVLFQVFFFIPRKAFQLKLFSAKHLATAAVSERTVRKIGQTLLKLAKIDFPLPPHELVLLSASHLNSCFANLFFLFVFVFVIFLL